MSKMKTFTGRLVSDNNAENQDTIHLSGGDSSTCYRIHKLELISTSEHADIGAVVKIYQNYQNIVTEVIDFKEDALLGAAIYRQDTGNNYPLSTVVTFDNEVFNQDIFITYKDNETSSSQINYLLVLEEIKVKDAELAVVNYSAALLHGE